LQLREATTFRTWWRVICGSADKMGLGRLAIINCRPDGTTRAVLSHHSGNPSGPCEVIHVVVPVPGLPVGSSLRVEVDIPADSSLEVAAHQLTLFARLIEANPFHARRPGEPLKQAA
jgi:hypothetical protein